MYVYVIYIFYIYVVIRYISHKAAAHFCDAPGTLIRLGVNKANVQVLLSTIPPTKNGRRLTRRMGSIYSKMGHGTWDMLSYVILFYCGILGDFLGYIVTTPQKKNLLMLPLFRHYSGVRFYKLLLGGCGDWGSNRTKFIASSPTKPYRAAGVMFAVQDVGCFLIDLGWKSGPNLWR